MIVAVIIACEIGFWVAVGLGLTARYLLGWKRTGLVLLAMAPVVDLILLVATLLHLRGGATAGFEHGLAAIYIGFSLTYGHRLIAWADRQFAYRFAGGPEPIKASGAAYRRLCWDDVRRTALAALITSALTLGLITMVGDSQRTQALTTNFTWVGTIFAIQLAWAIWNSLRPGSTGQSPVGNPSRSAHSKSGEMSKT